VSGSADVRVIEVVEQSAAQRQTAIITFMERPDKGQAEFMKLTGAEILMTPIRPMSLLNRLTPGVPVVLSFEYRGALHWFSTRVIRVRRPLGDEFVIKIPAQIIRNQRRGCYRVAPSISLPLRIRTFVGYNNPVSILVENLSQKGIAISFPDNAQALFKNNLATFELDLGRFGRVTLTALLRSTMHMASGRLQVGMEFSSPGTKVDLVLSDYLNARQREDLQRRRGVN
jgi:hypothetical protein